MTAFLLGFSLFLISVSHAFTNHLNNDHSSVDNTKDETKELVGNQMFKFEDFENTESSMAVSINERSPIPKTLKLIKSNFDRIHYDRLLRQETIQSVSGKLVRNPRDLSSNMTKNRKTREEKYPCYKYGRCSYNNLTYPPNCYCDDVCTIYNDCCHDVGASSNFTSLLPFEKTLDLYNFSSCVFVYSALENIIGENRGFYMVNRCPPFSNQSVENKCVYKNSSKSLAPVTDADGITYKNVYCAICHDVTSVTFWELGFNLDHCETFIDFLSLGETTKNVKQKIKILKIKCFMMYIPPAQFTQDVSVFPRVCLKYKKKWYDKSPSKRCRQYTNPILMPNEYLVRNYNCLKKKHKNETFSCVDPKPRPPMDFYRYLKENNSISTTVIFKFQSPERNQCTGPSVTFIKMDDTNLCVTENVRNYHMKIKVVLMSSGTPSLDVFKRAMVVFYKSLPTKKYKMKLYNADGKENNVDVVCGMNELEISNTCCTCTLNLSFIVEAELKLQEAIQLREQLRSRRFNFSKKVDDMSGQIRVHRFIESYNPRSFDPLFNKASCKGPLSGMKILQQFIFDYDLINSMNVSTSSEVNGLILDKQYLDDSGMILTQLDATTNPSLVPLLYTGNITGNLISVYTFVKYFVMGISIVSLLITLILYIYLGHYKSLIGQICVNIMPIFIVSNSVYLFGIEATGNKIVCSAIGAILHYTWISSFTWVSVYVFLVSQIMSKLKNNLSFNTDIYFSKQSIYLIGYCSPLIMVIPCVVMEIIQDSGLEIAYNVHLCFLSVYPANIVFLSGPIILSVVVSSGILLVLSQLKRKHDPGEIHVSSRIFLEYINAFLGYSLVSFLLWLLGILAHVFKNDIPDYIFTIVIGSHGPLFSICILCSKRVQNTLCFISNRQSEKCVESNVSTEIGSKSIKGYPRKWSELVGESSENCPNLTNESYENNSATDCQENLSAPIHECPKTNYKSTSHDSDAKSEFL